MYAHVWNVDTYHMPWNWTNDIFTWMKCLWIGNLNKNTPMLLAWKMFHVSTHVFVVVSIYHCWCNFWLLMYWQSAIGDAVWDCKSIPLYLHLKWKFPTRQWPQCLSKLYEHCLLLYRLCFQLPGKVRKIDISASGSGFAVVQVSYRYNLNVTGAWPLFTLDPQVDKNSDRNHLQLSVCSG
jgi:hypothetical protein